jgi:opacity protein-like surface antigen
MRKAGIVVAALVCLAIVALAAHAAEAPIGTDMKGRFGIGVMGGLGLPTGKLGQEINVNTLSAVEGLPGGQKMTGHYGVYVDYFVAKEFAVGADFGYLSTKGKDIEIPGEIITAPGLFESKTMQFGLHGKYFIPTGGQVLPYLSLGVGMYNRKLELSDFGKLVFQDPDVLGPNALTSYSDTKPGMNGGAGIEFRAGEMFGVGVSGMYHMSFGKLEASVLPGFPKETILKDWQYMAFNAAVTYYIPMAKK